MSYRIEVLPAAVRSIRKLPPEAKRRIQAAVELLADEPRPPAAKKLTGRPEWRVRTGDYRILYRSQDEILLVVVVAPAPVRDLLVTRGAKLFREWGVQALRVNR